VEQSLFSRVGNADMNLGGSSPQDNSGLGTILSPPPGPHTFQPGIGGYGSPTDAVALPGTDNADVSGKEGLCQVGRLCNKSTQHSFYQDSFFKEHIRCVSYKLCKSNITCGTTLYFFKTCCPVW
jgi:hypothetical protein